MADKVKTWRLKVFKYGHQKACVFPFLSSYSVFQSQGEQHNVPSPHMAFSLCPRDIWHKGYCLGAHVLSQQHLAEVTTSISWNQDFPSKTTFFSLLLLLILLFSLFDHLYCEMKISSAILTNKKCLSHQWLWPPNVNEGFQTCNPGDAITLQGDCWWGMQEAAIYHSFRWSGKQDWP